MSKIPLEARRGFKEVGFNVKRSSLGFLGLMLNTSYHVNQIIAKQKVVQMLSSFCKQGN